MANGTDGYIFPRPIQRGIWQNIKNRERYLVTGVRIDCTNNREGWRTVDYENHKGEKLSREFDEFLEKFTFITGLI